MCVCLSVCLWEKQLQCVCVCVWERERETYVSVHVTWVMCMCETERTRARERQELWSGVCHWVWMHHFACVSLCVRHQANTVVWACTFQRQSSGAPSPTLNWTSRLARPSRSPTAAPQSPLTATLTPPRLTDSVWASCPTSTAPRPARGPGEGVSDDVMQGEICQVIDWSTDWLDLTSLDKRPTQKPGEGVSMRTVKLGIN